MNQQISQSHIEYPGLYHMIEKYLASLDKYTNDIDTVLLFHFAFTMVIKYLRYHKMTITKENIYNIMEMLWKNPTSRQEIIEFYNQFKPQKFLELTL